MHYCKYCLEDKPANSFPKDAGKPHGISTMCRQCKAEYDRNRRQAMPDKFREWRRVWRQNHIEYARAYDRDRQKRLYWEKKNANS